MIPICLITGFLGSGKTTLLKRIIHNYRNRRLVYLINEFSLTDIDGVITEAEGGRTITVKGGSIFCRCKVTEFIKQLRAIPRYTGSSGEPVSGLVVEASGVADPRVIHKMLAESGFTDTYELTSIITVVDPGSFHKLLVTLPNITAQVESANIAVINKTDLYDEKKVAATEKRLRLINQTLEIYKTTFADVTLDIFSKKLPCNRVKGDYTKGADSEFARLELPVKQGFDLDNFIGIVSPYLDEIYRIKGFVPGKNGVCYVDYSKAGWTVSSSLRQEISGLVLIVKGAAFNKLKHLLIDSGEGTKSPGRNGEKA